MKNQLTDLNNHLFAQLERLGNEDMTAEQLDAEINRSQAISGVADRVIGNAALVLKAQIARHDGMVGAAHPMLTDGSAK